MDAERWKKIDQVIDAALELPEDQREEFVSSQTTDDPKLRDEVLLLLKAQKEGDNFLLNSAMKVAAQTIARDSGAHSTFVHSNKTIATYQIERLIGAGGMGEVYLAFDEKLKRKVALKILPAEYGSNDERVKRFELEARAISSLNHPNIVTIYDVGTFEQVNYIATEFVEGKTLRDLMGGQYKIRNILINSIQICDALSAAHKKGIIHRDIKPENIMIRRDGYAKILDFGLAKLTELGPETNRDMATTSDGVIIGTPAYMSPAQISDERIDHRTDLWSSGVVLYEFLAGRNPFKGANRQETFEAILSKDPPPLSSFNPDVPPELDSVLAKLLKKNPADSYQTASELRADLKRIQREMDSYQSLSGEHPGSFLTARGRRFGFVSVLLGGIAAVIGLILIGYFIFASRTDPDAIDWSDARNTVMTDHVGTEYFPSFAPDGKSFVYAAEENGKFDIFSQRIGEKGRTNLTADSAADDTQPAYSPDGKFIAFRSDRSPRGIYVMDTAGQNVRPVSDSGYHPSWSPDGKEIVISSFGRDQPTVRPGSPGSVLTIVNVATGLKRELARMEASLPTWSPHGQRIAYWFYTGSFGRRDIATMPAEGGEPVIVAKGFAVSNWNPVWSPDGRYLYFVSSKAGNMNFWRVRIDEATGQVLSQPEAVIVPGKYARHLSFSHDGRRMLYVQTDDQANLQAVGFDLATGKTTNTPYWITKGDREVARAELSPDGSRFVMRVIRRTQDDLATVDRDGNDWRDVTNDEPFDRYSRWSPDGTRLAFVSDRNGGTQVWVSNADGSGLRQITFTQPNETGHGFPVWSPDGKQLAVHVEGTIRLMDPDKNEYEQQPPTLPKDPRYRMVPWDWSPDGTKLLGVIAEGDLRHIGYYSFETNRYQIVLEKVDSVPSWLPDGRRFIYALGNKIFMGDTESKQATEILSVPNLDIRSPFVSRDGKLLYYVAASNESDIWLLDLTAEK